MEGFLSKMEEGEGPKGKIALHPLPLDAEQGRGRWAPVAALAGGPGHGGGQDQGKRERGRRGSDSPTHLGRRWSVEGGRRWRAEVAGYGRGGGAADLGKGRVVVEMVAVA